MPNKTFTTALLNHLSLLGLCVSAMFQLAAATLLTWVTCYGSVAAIFFIANEPLRTPNHLNTATILTLVTLGVLGVLGLRVLIELTTCDLYESELDVPLPPKR